MQRIRQIGAHFAGNAVYRRLSRNAGWLFSTQVLGGLIGVLTLAMMARALGPTGLGLIAIVLAYVRIVDRLTRLEPWQAVIRYGVEAVEADNSERLRRLVKASVLTDLVGSLIAGSLAVGLAATFAPYLNLPEGSAVYMQVLALGLFVTFRPTGLAILRIFDRFDLLAKIDLGVIVIRFFLTLGAFLLGLGLWAYVAILLIESLLNGIVAFVFGLRELRRQGHGDLLGVSLRGVRAENQGLLRLLWNSNINVILRQSTQRFDVIILSALASPAAVGAYFLARRLAEATLKLARPISQVVYPELVRTWTSKPAAAFRSLVTTVSMLLFGVCAVLYVPAAIFMGDILALAFGEPFREAALLVNVQMLAVAIYLGGIVANPAMLAVGGDRELVRITLAATLVFFVLIVPLIMVFGAVGLSLNHLIFNVIWLAGCVMVLHRRITTRTPDDPPKSGVAA